MTSTIVLCFIAGVLAANATPHFVKGITKEQFPTPFTRRRCLTSSAAGPCTSRRH